MFESNIENAFSDRIIYRRTIFNSNRQVSIPLALVHLVVILKREVWQGPGNTPVRRGVTTVGENG
jgi:hypothetical protein